ncbi:MAG: hypothetical protein H0W65_06340 [Sphingomonas sp.]|uniref:hypothetical protein n=1 Tax=Sphingomonas sp. TaxID=28214 RepID=UPI0017A1C5F7|nr:hypothetical protein [Sphingomonas sp.]MBA3667324.1 hypothetical protein [Sphingomonas sp.]
MTHDPEGYRESMREFRKRLGILNDVLLPFVSAGVVAIPNCELAALQLRKMYELIGFASLSANRHRYVVLRKRYEKDWNLAEILVRIEKVNPAFLPIGLDETYAAGTSAAPHILRTKGSRIDKTLLLEHHGRLANLLHARNPYRPELDYEWWHGWLQQRARELVETLELHTVAIEYQKTIYRVALRDAETDDVSVTVMNFNLVSGQ